MKEIFRFSLILGAILIVLIIAFIIGSAVVISTRVENAAPNTSPATDTNSADPNDNSCEILIIFDGDDCFISQLNITDNGELQFSAPFSNGRIGDLSLKEYMAKSTPDEAVTAICGSSAHFIKISPKKFTEITDRYGGLVYNEGNGREVMLTGAQALTVLNSNTFTDFVMQITAKARNRNLYDLFLFICNNTENNLSYINFYDAFKKENAR